MTHRFVDVATMLEIATAQEAFPIPHLLRDAHVRSVADLSGELRRVKAPPYSSSTEARWASRYSVARTLRWFGSPEFRRAAAGVTVRERSMLVAEPGP